MKLREIFLKGYKSVDGAEGQTLSLGDVTVLLGANGSGKSNLVSFFAMLHSMTNGTLQQFVGRQGVSRLLFYGPKQTESISFELRCESGGARRSYGATLSYGLPDRLFIGDETITIQRTGDASSEAYSLGSGGSESGLKKDKRPAGKELYALLSGVRTYQFHDTSDTAKIRDRGYVDDAGGLQSDAGNLAAFLKMLQGNDEYEKYYERIVRRIRRVMPQFGDFDLKPVPGNEDYVRLNWKDSSGSGYLFGPDQISDGSLRFMALATLLLQPAELLPGVIVLDEPELGLHPAAIAELGGIVRSAAQKTQVVLATQSTRLIDEFPPEDLVIVERDEKKRSTVFRRLDAERLQDWLDRYSLSELWEKDVLGGRP